VIRSKQVSKLFKGKSYHSRSQLISKQLINSFLSASCNDNTDSARRKHRGNVPCRKQTTSLIATKTSCIKEL